MRAQHPEVWRLLDFIWVATEPLKKLSREITSLDFHIRRIASAAVWGTEWRGDESGTREMI